MGKIGLGRMMDISRRNLTVMAESTVVPEGKLQAGGCEHSAKQKAFGTVLARAPSPASDNVPKKPHCSWGAFSSLELKRRGARREEGYYKSKALRSLAQKR
jgi:hypothetical protein